MGNHSSRASCGWLALVYGSAGSDGPGVCCDSPPAFLAADTTEQVYDSGHSHTSLCDPASPFPTWGRSTRDEEATVCSPCCHPPVPPSCCTSAAVFCRAWVSSCCHPPTAASCCTGSCGSRWGKLLLVLWRERVANPSKRGLAVGNAPLGSIALQAAHWLVEMSMEREAVLGHLRLCSCPFGDMLSLFL